MAAREIEIAPLGIRGDLRVPSPAAGLVLFAHGSGSSRHSVRNRRVAAMLREHGLATLLFDLLTPAEAQTRARVFDIVLLAGRLAQVQAWTACQPALAPLPLGLFGASTGAAAALAVAATVPMRVAAVVSRGGRPDLAAEALPQVRAPTLLIVGAADHDVVTLNRKALRSLNCTRRLELIPGATHLFEEPGALESVAELAADWFDAHLQHPA